MSNRNKDLFVIFDGNALIYRAYHGMPGLATKDGRLTGATFDFTRRIKKFRDDDYVPMYMAVCFDRGKSKRDEIYEDYKADREKPDDELLSQLEDVKEIIEAYGVQIAELDGYEADDLIATLTKKAENNGLDTLIVTIDKDMLQLVSPHVKVYRIGIRRAIDLIYDAELVKEKYGVAPELIPDYLALIGDQVDNIPGVYGIGKKTAPKLINDFGTVEQIFQNLDQVPSRFRKKLEESLDDAKMSKALASLQSDIDLPFELEDCKVRKQAHRRLAELFTELEFYSLIDKPKMDTKDKVVFTESEFEALLEKLSSAEEFAIDLETDSLDTIEAMIVGISFSLEADLGYYIPINHRYINAPKMLPPDYVLGELKPILEDPNYGKIGQNIKFDMKVLKCHGIDLKGISFDTMIASYLLHPTDSGHNLDKLVSEYLMYSKTPIKKLIGTGSSKITMDQVAVEKVSHYAAEDADAAWQLKNIFVAEIETEEEPQKLFSTSKLFYDVELPLIPVLAEMELAGIKVDLDYLSKLSKEFGEHLNEMVDEIYDLAGESFNVNSPKQLSHILFDKLELPKSRRTKTGYSTNVRVLESLVDKHALPAKILDYRQFAKLKSTYVDALRQMVNENTGRIHTSFQQAITRTGRLSSRDPNLQNIPIRTEEGRKIRRAFVAEGDDKLLLTADYSQIELRVLAHLSSDEKLIEAFRNDVDIHSQAAALIFNVPVSEVEKDMRRRAKTMNYGIIYGIGAHRLSNELKIDYHEAQDLIDGYFQTYRRVKEYFDRTVEAAERNGYVETLFGRRCYVPEIREANYREYEFGKRAAINAPVQGTAADLIKIAMLKIAEYLSSSKKKTQMLLQVHDELVFEVPKSELPEVEPEIRNLMENSFSFDVPIKVDISTGKNWLEAK